jgi:hypothetical protein
MYRIFRWRPLAASVLVTALVAPVAYAGTLVTFPFTSNLSAIISDPSVGSATLDDSHLTTFSTTVGNDGFGVVAQFYPNTGGTSEAGSLSTNSFFSITLTASSGNTLDLGSLSFNVGKGGNDADPRGYFIRSSLDGFSTDLLSVTLPAGLQMAPAPETLDLSSAFSGLNTVTFDIYVFAGNEINGTFHSVDFSDLSFSTPAVAVPEPSSLFVFAVGFLGLGWMYRRRASGAGK